MKKYVSPSCELDALDLQDIITSSVFRLFTIENDEVNLENDTRVDKLKWK